VPAAAVAAISVQTAHAALARSFHWVMLYGGLGTWILVFASFRIFRHHAPDQHSE
jgi:hypothetical protein